MPLCFGEKSLADMPASRSRSSPNLRWTSACPKSKGRRDGEQFRRPLGRTVMSMGAVNVSRFDGAEKSKSSWDGLRRDSELWFPDGDCYVYLYGRDLSRRGPSFRLPYAAIRSAGCYPMLDQIEKTETVVSPSSSSGAGDEYDYFTPQRGSTVYELYIPAPPSTRSPSREEAFDYHLATRNFFAWMFCKPLVGTHLGRALVNLLHRMGEFRTEEEDNLQDLLDYMDEEGYADFRDCPDHALAALHLAEVHRLRDLWVDAFVHCVGMNERLAGSAEYETVDRVTDSLMTRARLEMDIRNDHAARRLTSFLDHELCDPLTTLHPAARTHLDRFRSFLHSYHVGKFGYWPPGRAGSEFPKSACRAMYVEFRDLYEYLVDTSAGVSGSGAVLDHVNSFDSRYKHTPLPHPLPLLPQHHGGASRAPPSRLSRTFSRVAKADVRLSTLTALSAATNSHSVTVMECPLVRAYMRFERETTTGGQDKGVTPAEARGVRWVLIYATLQTLISVTRAPAEVTHTEGVDYDLCVQTGGTPPWGNAVAAGERPAIAARAGREVVAGVRETEREVYLPENDESDNPAPVPVPTILPLSRTLSIKSPQPRRVASWTVEEPLTLTDVSDVPPLSLSLKPGMPASPSNVSSALSSPKSPSWPESSRWSLSTDGEGLPEMDHLSVDSGRSGQSWQKSECEVAPAPDVPRRDTGKNEKRGSRLSLFPRLELSNMI